MQPLGQIQFLAIKAPIKQKVNKTKIKWNFLEKKGTQIVN